MLIVGGKELCDSPGVVVHACKSCHARKLGYKGSLPQAHENYLSVEDGDGLWLNLIDPDKPLFYPQSFEIFLDFVYRHKREDITIHCDQGRSRAPSLALLARAKIFNDIDTYNYFTAERDFCLDWLKNAEPGRIFAPGKGIRTFLIENWEKL